MFEEARVLLLACIDITFILKKADDSIHSVVKKWTTTNLSEMKRDVEMENIYGTVYVQLLQELNKQVSLC